MHIIYRQTDRAILFKGDFKSFANCLEAAAALRTDLSYADLSGHNLSGASLDEIKAPGASFAGCNLTGANLSEACLREADFSGCDLYNTCLAYSDLTQASFMNAEFGATDISGACLEGCSFNTPSALSLDFICAKPLHQNRFLHTSSKTWIPFHRPPIVIKGLGRLPTALFDAHSLIHDRLVPRHESWICALSNIKNKIQ